MHRSLMVSAALLLAVTACDPFDAQFEPVEDTIAYAADEVSVPTERPSALKFMAWNVKYGAGRADFFFDCHGDRGYMTKAEVETNLDAVARAIDHYAPDVIFVEEIEVASRRSSYVDQIQYLLDHTTLNYAEYGSVWKVDFVPSDGFGPIDMGNAILSRWPLADGVRKEMEPIGEQDDLTEYFYLRRNTVTARVDLPGDPDVWAVVVHTAAYSHDGTKKKHIDRFVAELDRLSDAGETVVGGGDLNTVPPRSVKSHDYPDTVCDERFEADDYRGEEVWLAPLYDRYQPAISLDEYEADNSRHFTHTTDKSGFWNRKLDFLFSNGALRDGQTHQDSGSGGIDTMPLSDHAPMSVILDLESAP